MKWFAFALLFCPFYLKAQITVNNNFERGNGIATYIDNANNEVYLITQYKGGDFYK